MIITNDKGTKFRVVTILPKAKYGLDNSVINDSDDSLIEFHLVRESKKDYFISRYYRSTIIRNFMNGKDGLQLEGSEPSYYITPYNVKEVVLKTLFDVLPTA